MSELPPLAIHKLEVEVELTQFEEQPVLALAKFLECFDSDGKQVFQIPSHVNEFLAVKFTQLFNKKTNTLDATFGGKVSRQRNKILRDADDFGIVFDMIVGMQELRVAKTKSKSAGTPYENTAEKIGEENNLSEEAVKGIYKRSKGKSS